MYKYKSIAFGVLMAGALPGGCHKEDDFSEFDALTIVRSGSFELEMTHEEALPLFTAPGEKLWISIWDPAILNGDGFEKGTVFVTTNHGHTTYWLVVDYDTDTKHAQYVCVTPQAKSKRGVKSALRIITTSICQLA